MLIYKEFTFDSAHFLPNVTEGHKCKNIHGHTFYLKIYVEGEIDVHFGWVIDFTDLKEKVRSVIDQVDHKLLNDIEGLKNPTSELFAKWIWDKLKINLTNLKRIELKETPTSGVIYEGD